MCPSYTPYAGQIKITGNTLDCQPDGMNCLILATTDPVVTGNQINATGSAVGIKVEGALPQAALIPNNTISIQSGQGIVVNSPQTDDSVIESNTISGSSAVSGIWIASPAVPNGGGDLISGNTITGFKTPIYIDPSLHPGTIVVP